MRNRYLFEVVTLGLLMAASSVLGPVRPLAGCSHAAAISGTPAGGTRSLQGGRG